MGPADISYWAQLYLEPNSGRLALFIGPTPLAYIRKSTNGRQAETPVTYN